MLSTIFLNAFMRNFTRARIPMDEQSRKIVPETTNEDRYEMHTSDLPTTSPDYWCNIRAIVYHSCGGISLNIGEELALVWAKHVLIFNNVSLHLSVTQTTVEVRSVLLFWKNQNIVLRKTNCENHELFDSLYYNNEWLFLSCNFQKKNMSTKLKLWFYFQQYYF